MAAEGWARIDGYPGYAISDRGRVMTLKGTRRFGTILRDFDDTHGYRIVFLCNNGKRCKLKVHRLVASAFVPNPKHKSFVNHLDFSRSNNRYSNLEWVTARENTQYIHDRGRAAHVVQALTDGRLRRNARRNSELDPKILALSRTGISFRAIGRSLNVTHNYVSSRLSVMEK